ncbi:MAG: YggT family protein [Chloroflexi bacterium]|nr:MAG: YggT family protein [Chloroflexota bacterium]
MNILQSVLSIVFLVALIIAKYGISLVLLAMFARAIASWFRMDERFAFIRFLAYITDPFIVPVRRFVPPVGMFDMGFLLAAFLLITLQTLLLQALS